MASQDTSTRASPQALAPILSVIGGIAAFSAMDAVMKGASIAVGVFTALLLRNVFGTVLSIPLWLAAGRPLPTRRVLFVHIQRSAVTAVMAWLFFYGLVRIPMAEGLALSFLAPIVALWFASIMLGEKIRPRAIAAALFGIVGVVIIGTGRFSAGGFTPETIKGTIAILCSAVFYALNLVLQRKQALLAGPFEIALFQNGVVALLFLALAPWLAMSPPPGELAPILLGAALATLALLLLSWGYARAEAQVLVPIEYTGFLWAALFGWLLFDEKVGLATICGAALIVAGCWIAARNAPPEPASPLT